MSHGRALQKLKTKKLTDEQDIANAFNLHFTSRGTCLRRPPCPKRPSHHFIRISHNSTHVRVFNSFMTP